MMPKRWHLRQQNRILVLIDLKIFEPMSVIAGTLCFVGTLAFMFNAINVLYVMCMLSFNDMYVCVTR